ncbi:unnamed protein product [Fusarium graminearum]|uniref:Uncharacterized protein n=1 Tax=Gibberella zeae TaxID=5518 RepID=A0A4E9EJQ2_GIBZA|nr:unnamed protein product [Fusarium graminearum]CAF3534764.1 unnamed protein product [Fusarium graminearum]CAG1994152.1 unnamed protein product [Fusarium graminearum]
MLYLCFWRVAFAGSSNLLKAGVGMGAFGWSIDDDNLMSTTSRRWRSFFALYGTVVPVIAQGACDTTRLDDSGIAIAGRYQAAKMSYL